MPETERGALFHHPADPFAIDAVEDICSWYRQEGGQCYFLSADRGAGSTFALRMAGLRCLDQNVKQQDPPVFLVDCMVASPETTTLWGAMADVAERNGILVEEKFDRIRGQFDRMRVLRDSMRQGRIVPFFDHADRRFDARTIRAFTEEIEKGRALFALTKPYAPSAESIGRFLDHSNPRRTTWRLLSPFDRTRQEALVGKRINDADRAGKIIAWLHEAGLDEIANNPKLLVQVIDDIAHLPRRQWDPTAVGSHLARTVIAQVAAEWQQWLGMDFFDLQREMLAAIATVGGTPLQDIEAFVAREVCAKVGISADLRTIASVTHLLLTHPLVTVDGDGEWRPVGAVRLRRPFERILWSRIDNS